MGTNNSANPQVHEYADAEFDLKEIVMGLHWDPQPDGLAAEPDNLDALCVLLDEHHCVLEIVHPGRPRSANGSVIHTGDARTGASAWDDERIFVFLEALPGTVTTIAFVVASATGGAFGAIRGASCHVSDRITEREWIRLELTALGGLTAHCVATLHRDQAGWKISTEAQIMRSGFFAEPALLSLAEKVRGPG